MESTSTLPILLDGNGPDQARDAIGWLWLVVQSGGIIIVWVAVLGWIGNMSFRLITRRSWQRDGSWPLKLTVNEAKYREVYDGVWSLRVSLLVEPRRGSHKLFDAWVQFKSGDALDAAKFAPDVPPEDELYLRVGRWWPVHELVAQPTEFELGFGVDKNPRDFDSVIVFARCEGFECHSKPCSLGAEM